jgi:hypothetical protein
LKYGGEKEFSSDGLKKKNIQMIVERKNIIKMEDRQDIQRMKNGGIFEIESREYFNWRERIILIMRERKNIQKIWVGEKEYSKDEK